MSTPTSKPTLRKVRAYEDVPYHVIHPDFEKRRAEQEYGPNDELHEILRTGHMLDEVTRERAKRMHYAAYRLEIAKKPKDRTYWRSIYHGYRNQIVMGNRKLIYRAVQRWSPTPSMEEDLIGDCQIVFVQAVGAYNPWMGVRFSTYAFTCLMRALSRISQRRAGDKNQCSYPLDTLEDPTGNAEENIELGTAFLDPYLRDEHELLTSREKKVLIRRYRLGDSEKAQTLEEVGSDLGLSKERVRQVQSLALDKLRSVLTTTE